MSSDAADDATVEYVQPKSVKYLPEVVDDDPDGLDRDQLRFRIAREMGITTRPDTPFTMLNLNSIHAYLTGSFYFPKRAYNTPASPEIPALREAVADAAEVADYGAEDDFAGRPYRREELVAICRAIENNQDERPRPPTRKP